MMLLVYGAQAPAVAERLRVAGYPGEIVAHTTPEGAAQDLPRAEILLASWLPRELYARATNLRWIQSMNAGVDDLSQAPLPPGVPVTRVRGTFGAYIGEYMVGWLLHQVLKMDQALAQQGRREWQKYRPGLAQGKRVGVAGVGAIGQAVATRMAALETEVVGLSRTGTPVAGVSRVYPVAEIDAFMTGLDVLCITLPLTAETRGLFGREQFRRMAPGSLVINAGRGAVVRDEDLLAALDAGEVGHAVLDVFATEPLPADHPYWTHPGVIVTPHVSGPSTPDMVADYFLANFARFRKGEALVGYFDPQRGY